MTPTFFAKIGEALYGPAWRAALAESLGIAERTVRRWAGGDSTIPSGIKAELAALCRKHSDRLLGLAKQLDDS